MTKRDLGKHYFKQWREHRKLSLAKAVARMEVEPGGEPLISAMSLSRIERGLQPYSEEIVMALAAVYDCKPYELFTMNPLVDGLVIDLNRYVLTIPAKQAGKALRLLKTGLGE